MKGQVRESNFLSISFLMLRIKLKFHIKNKLKMFLKRMQIGGKLKLNDNRKQTSPITENKQTQSISN